MGITSGISTGASAFARDGSIARGISGGLGKAARRIHGGGGPIIGAMSGVTKSGTARQRAGTAMQIMANYPRRTGAGAAGVIGAYGANRRRGSQNYPMY